MTPEKVYSILYISTAVLGVGFSLLLILGLVRQRKHKRFGTTILVFSLLGLVATGGGSYYAYDYIGCEISHQQQLPMFDPLAYEGEMGIIATGNPNFDLMVLSFSSGERPFWIESHPNARLFGVTSTDGNFHVPVGRYKYPRLMEMAGDSPDTWTMEYDLVVYSREGIMVSSATPLSFPAAPPVTVSLAIHGLGGKPISHSDLSETQGIMVSL